MIEQVKQLVGYVQERCLWQFASRTWDRTENIEGVLKQVGALLKRSFDRIESDGTEDEEGHFMRKRWASWPDGR